MEKAQTGLEANTWVLLDADPIGALERSCGASSVTDIGEMGLRSLG